MTQPTHHHAPTPVPPAAQRIMAMRAAYDSVDQINAVVQEYRSGGQLARALEDLSARWPELSVVPWRRAPEIPEQGGQ